MVTLLPVTSQAEKLKILWQPESKKPKHFKKDYWKAGGQWIGDARKFIGEVIGNPVLTASFYNSSETDIERNLPCMWSFRLVSER